MHTRPLVRSTTSLIAVTYLACTSAVHAQTSFNLFVPAYNSPNFTNTLGTGFFHSFGRTTTLLLTPGVPLNAYLDDELDGFFNRPPTNSDPTVTFSSTIVTPVTLNGLTQNVPFDFTFTPAGLSAGNPHFADGPPVTFNYDFGSVTVTPISDSLFYEIRSAQFLLTSSAVPEPGSIALFLGLIPVGAVFLRKRRKAHDLLSPFPRTTAI